MNKLWSLLLAVALSLVMSATTVAEWSVWTAKSSAPVAVQLPELPESDRYLDSCWDEVPRFLDLILSPPYGFNARGVCLRSDGQVRTYDWGSASDGAYTVRGERLMLAIAEIGPGWPFEHRLVSCSFTEGHRRIWLSDCTGSAWGPSTTPVLEPAFRDAYLWDPPIIHTIGVHWVWNGDWPEGTPRIPYR